jgi:hypothetical protein
MHRNAGQGKKKYTYYKCKRSRVSGTCNNYSVRTAIIEEAVAEHFRTVWPLSTLVTAPGRCDLPQLAESASLHGWGRPGAVRDLPFRSSAG